jgi:hypothetical protein
MLGSRMRRRNLPGRFTPQTWWGLFLRNQVTKALAIPYLATWLMGSSLLDLIDLPDYSKMARQPA